MTNDSIRYIMLFLACRTGHSSSIGKRNIANNEDPALQGYNVSSFGRSVSSGPSTKEPKNETSVNTTRNETKDELASPDSEQDDYQIRIVGGHFTSIDYYPFMATLIVDGLFVCGGSLISQYHVLTAGHCCVEKRDDLELDLTPNRLTIRLGSTYNNKGGILLAVAWIFTHPKYRSDFYDVSVVELEKEVTFTDLISPVSLALTPSDTESLEDMMKDKAICSSMGWGSVVPRSASAMRTAGGHEIPFRSSAAVFLHYLQVVDMYLISWNQCQQIMFINANKDLCTNLLGARGTCQGDSGGPLICHNKQYGITSWGIGCARESKPDIFARVDAMADFINKSMDARGQNKYNSRETHRTERSYDIVLTLITTLQLILQRTNL